MGMGMWTPEVDRLKFDPKTGTTEALDFDGDEYQDRVREARADWAYKQADAMIERSKT
jgi:hypothetical protein